MAEQWWPLLRPLRSQVLVERASQRHVHELHPPADAQCGDAEQPGQQHDVALPHVAPGNGRLGLGMRLLAEQTGRQITATGQDQSTLLSHHRPDHPKEQRKGVVIAQQLQGIIALDQGERRNEAGEAPSLQNGMHGGRIPTIGRPASISHIALCSEDADAWPLAQAQVVALLLFRYPVRKQITDRRILNRLYINWRKKGHSVTPTRYLTYDRLAEHA